MRFIRLNEDYMQDSNAGAWMTKHPDAYIHFTRTEKMGINPSASKLHRDIHGVYFYPVSWFTSGQYKPSQYGANMPYFYLVEIDRESNGVVLQDITKDEVLAIAQRNGWGDICQQTFNDPSLLVQEMGGQAARGVKEMVAAGHPGAILYQLPDAMFHYPKAFGLDKSPNRSKMFNGIDFIEDKGQGLIHEHEPMQLIVLNQKAIKRVIHFGETKHNHQRGLQKRLEKWLEARGFTIKYDKKVMHASKRREPYFKLQFAFWNPNVAPRIDYEYYSLEGRHIRSHLSLDDYWQKPIIYNSDRQVFEFDAIIQHVEKWLADAGEISDESLLWSKIRHDVDRVMEYSWIDGYRYGTFRAYLAAVCNWVEELKKVELPDPLPLITDIYKHGLPGVPTELVQMLYVNWKSPLGKEELRRSDLIGEFVSVVTKQMLGNRWDTESRKSSFDIYDPKTLNLIQDFRDQLFFRCDPKDFASLVKDDVVEYNLHRYQKIAGPDATEEDFRAALEKFVAGTILE